MELKLKTELEQRDTFADAWFSKWEPELRATSCCREVTRWSWRGYALTYDKRRLFVDLRTSAWRVAKKDQLYINGTGVDSLVTYLMGSSTLPGSYLDRLTSRYNS